MQALADYIRARASNLFWVEGISAGSLLNEAWQYHITGDGPLEYSEHRPPGRHQYQTWDSEFGYIARSGHAPVVEGEWADYARPNAPWACWDNAPVSAPRFLNYLQVRGFGLILTLLVKNQLIKSANLNDPTRFQSNWSCTAGPAFSADLDQGVGHQASSGSSGRTGNTWRITTTRRNAAGRPLFLSRRWPSSLSAAWKWNGTLNRVKQDGLAPGLVCGQARDSAGRHHVLLVSGRATRRTRWRAGCSG